MKALDLTDLTAKEREDFLTVFTRQHAHLKFYLLHVGLLDKPEEQRTLLVDEEMRKRLLFYNDFMFLEWQNGRSQIMRATGLSGARRREMERKLKPDEIYIAEPDPRKGKGWYRFKPAKLSTLPIEKAEPVSPELAKQVKREMAEEEFHEKVEQVRKEIEQKHGVKLK